MTRVAKKKGGVSRNRYSAEYKGEALALAEKVGAPAAAVQLGCMNRSCMAGEGRSDSSVIEARPIDNSWPITPT